MADEPLVPSWTLGDRLNKARKSAGVSVDEMAKYLGVTRNTVTNYETGRTTPLPSTVRDYATRCHAPAWWLLDELPVDGTFVERRRAQLDLTNSDASKRRRKGETGSGNIKWPSRSERLTQRTPLAA